jgi:cyclopropane-fatty-acyl-phospholipid synthase
VASRRVREAGLADRVTVLLRDYRDMTGQFDKLVSVEMIEAVGHEYYPAYLSKCQELLKPNGAALIQAITCPDQRYDWYRRSSDFLRRYIFPGGHLPSLTQLLNVSTAHTDFRFVRLQDFSPDYARTLAEWRHRFHAARAEILVLGYSGEFLRMWDFYLSICEAGFAEHYNGVVQFMLVRPGWRQDAA